MCFKILCLLIFLNSQQTIARGRIPIAKYFQNNTNSKPNSDTSSAEHFDLPRGFKPQLAPINPLLYPFVTEQPNFNPSSTTAGWRPIVTEATIMQSTSSTPLLQDRIANSAESQQQQQDFNPIAGPVMEAVVYGAWKPEAQPIQPNLTQTKNFSKEDNKGFYATLENIMKGKLGGFIDDTANKKSKPDSTDKSTSNESFENINTTKRQFKRKLGRQKIANSNKNQSNEAETESKEINPIEVIRVNSTDSALLSVAKQINESVETNNRPIKKDKSTENSNNSKQISKEWPTDFLSSPESQQTRERNTQINNFGFLDESTENPGVFLNGLDGTETKSTTSSAINITKMGVPFENQNSDEEPSICVPLAVREPSVSNPMEIVEVERVYCFPLPVPDMKQSIGTATNIMNFDKDAKFSVLSYEERLASSVRSLNKTSVWILSLIFLLLT